ncbi:hypothetical protein BVY04_02240 [bacterium M21]|nr:hypothetical protein BVY04_02240 [bacterium M21]
MPNANSTALPACSGHPFGTGGRRLVQIGPVLKLKALSIHVPPLRDRKEDIRDIANSWLYRKGWTMLSDAQVNQLKKYHWPGNGRQLINVLVKVNVLELSDYRKALEDEPGYQMPQVDAKSEPPDITSMAQDDAVRGHVLRVLTLLDENKSKTAKALGIARPTLNSYQLFFVTTVLYDMHKYVSDNCNKKSGKKFGGTEESHL